MKYEVTYLLDSSERIGDFYGSSAGEAFAKCLLEHPTCQLIKAYKEGNFEKAYGHTEWNPPPIQRSPELPPEPLPKPREPKYKQTPEPMPAMQEWARKHGLIS